jgi:broad specificity phosphatase PhoE
MSVLLLVRHGQASFLSDDYDRLSLTGETQSRLLGQEWIRREEQLDEVYVGPRRRQQDTADAVGLEFRSRRRSWPEPVVMPELDEYDLGGVITQLAPALAKQDAQFRELFASSEQESTDRPARFQRMFEVLMTHWQAVSDPGDGVEPWPIFRERVRSCLASIRKRPGRGRRVATFTSGGFIGTAVALALGAPDRTALELNWRLRNASVTRLLFTADRMTLDEFNSITHLSDRELWTYR